MYILIYIGRTNSNLGLDLTSAAPVMTELSKNIPGWGRDKSDAILQTKFSRAFPCMKIFESRLNFTDIFS